MGRTSQAVEESFQRNRTAADRSPGGGRFGLPEDVGEAVRQRLGQRAAEHSHEATP